MDTNYSISDLATISNGMGNSGGSLWFIILFFLIFNNNGWNRYGNGEFGQYATAASQQEILLVSSSRTLTISSIEDSLLLAME